MSETKIPELLKDRVDLKSLTVSSFALTIDAWKSGKIPGVSMGENTKLLIFTNFGIISGKLMYSLETKTEKEKAIEKWHEIVMEYKNIELDKFQQEGVSRLINDSGYIALTNVEIQYYTAINSVQHLEYFFLFPEQVVGLSIVDSK